MQITIDRTLLNLFRFACHHLMYGVHNKRGSQLCKKSTPVWCWSRKVYLSLYTLATQGQESWIVPETMPRVLNKTWKFWKSMNEELRVDAHHWQSHPHLKRWSWSADCGLQSARCYSKISTNCNRNQSNQTRTSFEILALDRWLSIFPDCSWWFSPSE